MTLQASGTIKLSEIATEFSDAAPHSLSEFYDAAAGVPASGAISLSDFYGTSSQGYGAFTVSTSLIPEDGTTVGVFTLNSVNIPAASTVGFTTAGSTVSLDGTDMLYSLDGVNYSDFNVTSGTLTISGDTYKIWVKAKADLATDPNEKIQINIVSIDSNGINTNAPSAFINIDDTSLTPNFIPTNLDTNESQTAPVACLNISDVESGDDPEVYSYAASQLRITRTASGFTVQGRMTSGDSCFFYDENNSQSSVGTAWQTLYVGNSGVAPDAFSVDGGSNWTNTPTTGSGFITNADVLATATTTDREDSQFENAVYAIWARATGYADTNVISKKFRLSALAEKT